MLDLLYDPNVWAAFLTLTAMEIVLDIDNIVFISVLVSRLPKEQADRARKLGLALALVFLILLLLTRGGAFLIYKATHEMHAEIDEPHEHADDLKKQASMAFAAIISQIIL